MAALADFVNYLSNNAAKIQVFNHPLSFRAPVATKTPRVTGEEAIRVGIHRADHRYIMTVIPYGRRLNRDLMKNAVKAKELSRVSGSCQARLFPGCDLRAIPPLGNLFGVLVVADSGLERRKGISLQSWCRYGLNSNGVGRLQATGQSDCRADNPDELVHQPNSRWRR